MINMIVNLSKHNTCNNNKCVVLISSIGKLYHMDYHMSPWDKITVGQLPLRQSLMEKHLLHHVTIPYEVVWI